MARKRRQNVWHAGELNLTAMIDIAFQLLAFFIVTVRPMDVFAHLNVFRPSPEKTNVQAPPPSNMIRIMVFPLNYAINDRPVELDELRGLLAKVASYDTTQTILIMCINAAPHEKLIALLDVCAEVHLTNLSVVSSGGY